VAELWLRDWIESWGLDVRILNQTMALGALNVTGPLAAHLLARAGFTVPLRYMEHTDATVAGVPCRVFRLSFTGELSYELHHPAADAVTLWRRLMELGADLGVKPHGIDALLKLRLEKGHIIVGQDTDYDSTPRRIRHEWAVKLDKDDFVGRQAVVRTNKIPLDRQLVGLEMEGPAPREGALIYHGGAFAGYVTSSTWSPVLGKAVMLGWLELCDGALPATVTIDGRPARRVDPPFYDPESSRARAKVDVRDVAPAARAPGPAAVDRGVNGSGLARLDVVRLVATPAALDAASWPDDAMPLRTAPDEVLLVGQGAPLDAPDVLAARVPDPHVIAIADTSFAGVWLPADVAATVLSRVCEWALPAHRPAFAQGAMAELPVKLWLEEERTLIVVPAPFATDLVERVL
ncbi:MAG: aminomethyltransferase family protein, partial [Caldilineaceae bacterium]|nr:aminomethyltransferase family protein [Caldilineaceae bacterium]